MASSHVTRGIITRDTCRLELDHTRLVCEVIYPGTVPRYDALQPEYSGYCPVALL